MKDLPMIWIPSLPCLETSTNEEFSTMTDLILLINVADTKGFIGRFDWAEWLTRVMISSQTKIKYNI
jgi:hypothetical protein